MHKLCTTTACDAAPSGLDVIESLSNLLVKDGVRRKMVYRLNNTQKNPSVGLLAAEWQLQHHRPHFLVGPASSSVCAPTNLLVRKNSPKSPMLNTDALDRQLSDPCSTYSFVCVETGVGVFHSSEQLLLHRVIAVEQKSVLDVSPHRPHRRHPGTVS